MKKQILLMISIAAIMLALICANPSGKAQPSNKQPTICDLQDIGSVGFKQGQIDLANQQQQNHVMGVN